MITTDEENYLATLPDDKTAHIFPYSPKLRKIAEELIATVRARHPDLKGLFGGAAGLGIAGQNDLDIDFLTRPENFERYFPAFVELFGNPRAHKDSVAAWSFEIEGVEVDLWLTDETSQYVHEQRQVFQLLQDDPLLRKEYEELKLTFDGKSYKDYQRAKYEFYHRVLGT